MMKTQRALKVRRAVGVAIGLFCVWLAWAPSLLRADHGQYFYDELGRLIGVVDGQNNAAVYTYDAVGNLLKIERFTTTGGAVGIFLLTPGSAVAKNPDGSAANRVVEIRGFGFTDPPTSNAVAFNGTAASVVSGDSASLLVTVPATATTGPVTVTNGTGSATSPTVFTVLVPPIITGIDPPKVPKGVVARMTVSGFHLKTASSVQFTQAGLSATILSGATDDNLPVNLTVGATVPNGDYPFTVTTPSGTAQSGTVTVAVTPAVPSFGAGTASVRNPAQAAPSGPSFGVGTVSVSMP